MADPIADFPKVCAECDARRAASIEIPASLSANLSLGTTVVIEGKRVMSARIVHCATCGLRWLQLDRFTLFGTQVTQFARLD